MTGSHKLAFALSFVSILYFSPGPVMADDEGAKPKETKAPSSVEEADKGLESLVSGKSEPEAEKPAGKDTSSGAAGSGEELLFDFSAMQGEAGLWRVHNAGSSAPWTIRISLGGGFFLSSGESGFLNYLGQSDYSESHVQGRLSLSWTPLEFLEAFASLRSSSNRNSLTRPELLQTQGDLEVGAKGFYPLIPYLSLGGDLAVQFLNGIGGLDPDFSGTSLRTSLLASFDARKLDERIPLRAHLNAGFVMENSGNLEDGRDLNIVEMFALRVNKYHRVQLGLGLDAPLAYLDPVALMPYLEYTVELPLGIGADELEKGSLGQDTAYRHVVGMRLTPGVRVAWRRDISFDVAVDVGIGGKKAYLEGVPPVPPYTVWFSLSYCFDPRGRVEEKIVEKVVEREKIKEVPAPVTTGRVAGRVLNARDSSPVTGAIISFEGAGIPPVASDLVEGRYETYDLTAGKVKLTASKEGFKPQTKEAMVEAGKMTELDFILEPEQKVGVLTGTVVDEKDKPVAAEVEVEGKVSKKLKAPATTGAFAAELPAGDYRVKVYAEGFLAKARSVKLEPDRTVAIEFKLTRKPKAKIVILRRNKIEVRRKIHFMSGRADIQPDSFHILDGVVDILVKNPQIKKVRIEGHTDSIGSAAFNKRLSQKRAEAVMKYLIEQGIEPQRLVAVGYGEERPIAPNNTRRGRAQNRRVEFVILEQ